MKREYDFRGKLFNVDPNWQKTLKRLPDNERLKIWDAIMDYRLNGEEIDLSGEISERALGVYWIILDTLGRFDDHTKEVAELKSEAGKLGMAKRWHNTDNICYEDNKDNTCYNYNKNNKNNIDNKNNKNNKNNLPDHTNTIPDQNQNQSKPNDNNFSIVNNACDINKNVTSSAIKQKKENSEKIIQIVDYYNAKVKESNSRMAICTIVSDKRKAIIGARLKEYGEENVKKAIDNAIKSDFFNNVATRSVANLEWIMRPSNFPKVLEDFYKDMKNPYANNPERVDQVIHYEGENNQQAYEDDLKNWF